MIGVALAAALAGGMLLSGCRTARPTDRRPGKATVATTPDTHDAVPPQGPEAPTTVPPALELPGPEVTFTGFAPDGQGHPTEFTAGRAAVLHFAGQRVTLPATLWFADEAAPDGETPFTFRMRSDGSGYWDFVFAGEKTPCRITDPDGNTLAVMDIKFSVEPEGDDRTRSVFRLKLVKP